MPCSVSCTCDAAESSPSRGGLLFKLLIISSFKSSISSLSTSPLSSSFLTPPNNDANLPMSAWTTATSIVNKNNANDIFMFGQLFCDWTASVSVEQLLSLVKVH